MAALPPPRAAEPGGAGHPRDPGDSAFETSAFERTLARRDRPRWLGWRRHALMAAAVLFGVAVLWLARWVASTPHLDAQWHAGPIGTLVLERSTLPALQAHLGRSLVALGGGAAAPLPADALLLHRSPRWQVADAERTRQVAMHENLAARLAAGPLHLHFADGGVVMLDAEARGFRGLGWLFWPLAALAWLLALSGAVVALARPQPRQWLYATMAWCQAGNLLFIGMETLPGLGLPPGVAALDMGLRVALDGCTGAAAVTLLARHPNRLPWANAMTAAAWAAVAGWLALAQAGLLVPLWWWAQGLSMALGGAALALAAVSCQREPNPHAMVLRRFTAATLATLALVTVAVALAARLPALPPAVVAGAPVLWTLFLASLLLLTPFLVRSRPLLHEFALLAGVGTVAASLELLFAAVFSVDIFTSLALALFIALAVYSWARQWMLNHMAGSSVPSTERAFELLYRVAREVQARPARYPALLGQLLRELFEPLEVFHVDRVPARTRVVGGGAALVVPARGGAYAPATALVLRHARQGQRLFTLDDARLVDRVLDQMWRAVAYDQAVERGRHEERQRIAQDLHDDIGARLLTLLYQAPTPAMEDYLRHTLQDLKTITRGLAAAEHRLSHAAVEWKTDLAQRLAAAQAELGWIFNADRDLQLTMVQWSALTRVLRELVSNALYHGHATRVDVRLSLEGGRLLLRVVDDGAGRDPQGWAHGLGLGGVRKRVKLLGGEVRWSNHQPRGIACEMRVEGFGRAP
ncbi:MAG: histidine kinase [Betaproteobacteria bacterium]|nr:histidine kinase [Betaproteobacteria bacterium]